MHCHLCHLNFPDSLFFNPKEVESKKLVKYFAFHNHTLTYTHTIVNGRTHKTSRRHSK